MTLCYPFVMTGHLFWLFNFTTNSVTAELMKKQVAKLYDYIQSFNSSSDSIPYSGLADRWSTSVLDLVYKLLPPLHGVFSVQ